MITIEINGTEFLVKSNLSVLEACKYVGIHIPRFCYHETLSVAGNCRMCLVEVANSPKPVASCALPILNNMKIFVDTPLVKKARENVLEILLLNHPLDCPICDQGGECDLQDQTKTFGNNYSRYFFNKTTIEDKYCGPLIKTIMTRCISCTRCVRFGSEIAGVEYLGTLNRGGSSEIGGYLSNFFNSEISGNVIDLCPVGALTAKPYAFRSRPWELRSVESIDLNDSLGSNIYINHKESEILRIIPKINKELNGSIITDKARFSYDSEKTQRLSRIFSKEGNRFVEVNNWSTILAQLDTICSTKKVAFIINNDLDFESCQVLKQISYKYKNISINNIDLNIYSDNVFISWLYSNVANLNKNSRICLFVSSNIRLESAIINSKLRLKYLTDDFSVYGTGLKFNSNFNVNFINLNVLYFIDLIKSKNILLSRLLLSFKNPFIFFNDSLSTRGIRLESITGLIRKYIPTAQIFNIRKSCNSEGISIVGISGLNSNALKAADYIFAINLEDNFATFKTLVDKKKKLFWFNTHSTLFSSHCDLFLPLASNLEKNSLFLNMEQRPQESLRVFATRGNSRSFFDFLFCLFDIKLPTYFSYLNEIVHNVKLFESNEKIFSYNFFSNFNIKNSISTYPLKSVIEDFYCSNKATKKSLVMSQCSQEYRKTYTNF